MSDNAKYDMTIPKPGAFQEFTDHVFPEGGSGPGLVYTSYDMEEAFAAGWSAAVMEHTHG